MNTTSPTPFSNPQCLHAWWRQQRGLMRLEILSLIKDYYRCFPRRFERYCPMPAKHQWTNLEPGPSGVTCSGLSDDFYFSSIRWKVSGITTQRSQRGGLKKTWCWMGSYTGTKPPKLWEIRRGGFTKDECEQVLEAMTRIYERVTAYQQLLEHYIQALLHLKAMQEAVALFNPEAPRELSQVLGYLPQLPGKYHLDDDAFLDSEEAV